MSNTDIPKYKHPQSSLIRPSMDTDEPTEKPLEVEAKPLEFKSQPKKRELTFKEKLKRSFVKDDIKDLGEYLIFDIVIPGLKRGLWETVVGTTSKALGVPIPSYWNSPFSQTGYSSREPRGYSPYNQTSPRGNASRNFETRSARSRYDIYSTNTITWDFREDADKMLERLLNVAKNRPFVSVHSFYMLAEIKDGNEYTNMGYGWSAQEILAEADVDNEGYGYYICLPAPKELPNNGRY